MFAVLGLLVSVEGLVGSGKSTLLKRIITSNLEILQSFGVLVEPHTQWQHLDSFYHQEPNAAGYMQLDVLFTMVLPMHLKQLAGFNQLRERSSISTLIFATLLYRANLIDKDLFHMIKYTIQHQCPLKYTAMYLVDTPPNVCLERAQRRNNDLLLKGDTSRVAEVANLSLQYLTDLDFLHRVILSKMDIPVIILDGQSSPDEVFKSFLNSFNYILYCNGLKHNSCSPIDIEYLTTTKLIPPAPTPKQVTH